MKVIVFLGLMFFSSTALSNYLSIKDFFDERDTTTVKISPKGDYLIISGYPEGSLKTTLFNLVTGRSDILFKGKRQEQYYLDDIHWVDNTTIYASTSRFDNSQGSMNAWIIELSDNSPPAKIQINARGHVLDPLPDQEDQLLFKIFTGYDDSDRVKIVKASINALKTNNFSKQKLFKPLLKKVDHYIPVGGKIQFAKKFDEENLITTYWYLGEKRRWKKIYEHEYREEKFIPIGKSRGGSIFVLSNKHYDKTSLITFDPTEKKFGDLIYTHPNYDLVTASYDEKKNEITSVNYFEQGIYTTKFLNAEDQRLKEKISRALPSMEFSVASVSLDGNHLVIAAYAADRPTEFYYFNRLKLHLTPIAYYKEKLVGKSLAQSDTIRVNVSENEKVEAFVTKPSTKPNGVLLLNPHGGPIGIQDTISFSSERQFLANRGYAILEVNFRGSSGYGRSHENQGREEFGKLIEQDITKALNKVLETEKFKHICSIGSSYGGFSAVTLAAKLPDKIDCVVARFGVYDLNLLFNDRSIKTLDSVSKRIESVVGKNRPELRNYSPVYFAQKIKAPVLITGGIKDGRTTIEHSNRLKLALESENKVFDTLFYINSAHGHRDKKSLLHEMAYIDYFIRKTLSLAPISNKRLAREERRILRRGFIDPFVLNQPERARAF